MPECFIFNQLDDFPACPVCGGEMKELHAKAVCSKCNYKRGCCDLL